MLGENILYLSYDGLTDPLGQSQILPYIEGLTKRGYAFTIISFEKQIRFKKGRYKIEERCTKSNIDWHPLAYTKTPPVLSTLYDIDKLQKKTEELHAQKSFALVHCRSYIPSLVALKLKAKYKTPFIFDMRGFWADERVDGKIWDLHNPIYKTIYRYFKNKERKFLEKADAVVSLTEAGKAELENWYNNDPIFGGNENYYNYDRAASVLRKTTVIPCATDLKHFDYNRISENKRKWLGAVHGIEPDREYLGYVGSLGTWYMADEMLDLYNHLLKSRPNLRFLILSHDKLDNLRDKADKLNIPRSYIIQISAERKDVPTLMSMMDVSVFFILPAYSKKASSPTKQGELMAMGIPIICNDNVGDTGEIIKELNIGSIITSFTMEEYCEISMCWNKISSIDPSIPRRGAEKYFSLRDGVDAYHSIYKNILSH